MDNKKYLGALLRLKWDPCDGIYAIMCLSEQDLGAGIVSHELWHSALCYPPIREKIARSKQTALRTMLRMNEEIAGHIGEMNRAFWNEYHKTKKEGE